MSKWCDTCYRNELNSEWKSCDSECPVFGKSSKEIAKIVIENNTMQTNHKNAVLQGLENMREYDGHGNGLLYSVNGVDYTTDQMIEGIKNDTEVGREFSQNVYDLTILYLGKFSQDAD